MPMSGARGRFGRYIVMLTIAAAAVGVGWYLGASPGRPAVPALTSVAHSIDPPAQSARITALGRLQPRDGVLRVAGPSQVSVVIARLQVDKGDTVQAGQVMAVLDNFEIHKTGLARLQAQIDNAQTESQRNEKLYRNNVVSISERDAWRLKVSELQAEIQQAQAEEDQSLVRAPISGRVLEVHTRAGEKVGPDGILELGDVGHMYAVAEVYETDIVRVHPGQRATISSPALTEPVQGTVERLGLKIARLNLLDTDPVARTDARIVPVEIRLDDSGRVAALTNLQVEVAIAP
jgi:HlyD family secretion protein